MVVVAQLVESRIVIPVVVGSSPIAHPSFYGPLAQLVEQLTLNQRVAGSIPARPTNKIKGLRDFSKTQKCNVLPMCYLWHVIL